MISKERKEEVADIPIESIREGEIVGDHRVIFDSDTERIELLHSAKTRDTFAAGAIKAVKFLKSKKNGLYTMRDVLAEELGVAYRNGHDTGGVWRDGERGE